MADHDEKPYVSADKNLSEITPLVIGLAIVLAVVLGAANAYLGLFAGLTVSASIPAAVISMALLKMFRGNILQNNAVQTAASAGESLAAGVIFTVPAMILLGSWAEFSYAKTTLIALFGGVLGVLFTIPLRRSLIIEQKLQFPEGVATAEVLKVGDQGGAGVRHILIAGLLGALFKLGAGMKLWAHAAVFARNAGGATFYVGSDLSPALVSVGFIVRLNIAILVFLGGALNWLVAIPIYTKWFNSGGSGGNAEAIAGGIWSTQTRYLGVGAMVVGGVWALIQLRSSLFSGITSNLRAYKKAKAAGKDSAPRTERDVPMQIVFVLIGLSLIPLFLLFHNFTEKVHIAAIMAVVVIIAGFLFSAVAAYMAGLVGSSNNPISGITIVTLLSGSLLLLGLGLGKDIGPPAAILIGGVVCCAAAIGGDNMQDLKAGRIVGSTPYKQQIMQIIGVVAAALVMAPILTLLHEAYRIGSPELSAPQAGLMASVAKGVFSSDLPWTMIGIGAAAAVVVIIVDVWLEKTGKKFRAPVLAMAVGIYLPFELSVPIFIGGIIAHLMERALRDASPEFRTTGERNGLLFAAGLITGEALIGICMALPIVISSNKNVLAIFGAHDTGKFASIPGMILLFGLSVWLYKVATSDKV